jgi:hypothetical protein
MVVIFVFRPRVNLNPRTTPKNIQSNHSILEKFSQLYSNIFKNMTKCTQLKRIIVHYKKRLVLDMKRMPDNTWKTLVNQPMTPKKAKRPKKGKMAALMRKHRRWLNR